MSAQSVYARYAAAIRNEMRDPWVELVTTITTLVFNQPLCESQRDWLLCDRYDEAEYLRAILHRTLIRTKVDQVSMDGILAEEDRKHLKKVLVDLHHGRLDDLAESQHMSRLLLDDVTAIDVEGRSFCFTGDFVFGPRSVCKQAVARLGGTANNSVTRKLHYLVVGGLGNPEWKRGFFGTTIEKAVRYRAAGIPLLIVHEDLWARSLQIEAKRAYEDLRQAEVKRAAKWAPEQIDEELRAQEKRLKAELERLAWWSPE